VADLRREYREAVGGALAVWHQFFGAQRIDYLVLETDQPMVNPLRTYLRKRERLG
jgi:hypothetical protein